VSECDREASTMRPWPIRGYWAMRRKKTGSVAICQYDIKPSASKHSTELSCLGEKLSASQEHSVSCIWVQNVKKHTVRYEPRRIILVMNQTKLCVILCWHY
jgi:hypothetical protein